MNTAISQHIHLGLCVMYPSPGVIERIGRDWDWIWLDGQHGQMAGYEQMLSMVRACHYVQTPAYVRIPSQEMAWLGMALDMGADAVIVPQVDTVEHAQKIVRAAKFPPLGDRSFGGRRPIDLYGRGYVDTANEKTKLICQIESPESLANAEAIAALPGVDGLFIGPDDLMLRLGASMTGDSDKKVLRSAISQVAQACQKYQKDCLCVGVGEEMTRLCAESGVNYIVAGGDVAFIAGGSKSALEVSREIVMSNVLKNGAPVSKSAGIY